MLINIEDQEKNKYRALLREKKVVQYWLDEAIKNCDGEYRLILPATNENKEWDEYIHPSYLDWTRGPDKQISGLEKKGQYNVHASANRMFHLGNLIHGAVQHLVPQAFDVAYNEIGLRIEKYKFKGTSDFVGYHPIMGWVLLEFKSYGELQRDKTGGTALLKRLESFLSPHKMDSSHERPLHSSQYASSQANISYAQMQKITERLMTCERDMSEVQQDHLTQSFTYTWLLSKLGYGVQRRVKNGVEILKKREIPKINWVCVCYIGKSKFETVEFWYPVKKNKDLIEKAHDNYVAVFKEAKKRGYIK